MQPGHPQPQFFNHGKATVVVGCSCFMFLSEHGKCKRNCLTQEHIFKLFWTTSVTGFDRYFGQIF